MRASIWIVTYNNAPDLQANLESLFSYANSSILQLQVNVINNHTQYMLPSTCWDKVRTWHNCLRSDSSLGHLARNWNQALTHGFGSLVAPQNDLVICCQDDVLWQPHWCEHVMECMQHHTLVTQGVGDAVVVYKPEAVRHIGMWDERFAPSFYHDGDYFLRALMYNKSHSSINDPAHGRILNPWPHTFATVPAANAQRVNAKNLSYGRARIPHQVWQHKWAVSPIHWSTELIQNPPHNSLCKNFITYPHFEMDVHDLPNKNYLI
jgi:hypothetical protein